MKLDAEGWLVAEPPNERPINQLPTVRTYPLETEAPLGLVWHVTGGVGGDGFAERLARRVQTYERGKDRPASFHVLIARNGTIYQSAPFTVGTWHVGEPGTVAGRAFKNVNRATIGIELENAGQLVRMGGEYYAWPYYLDPSAPPSERRPDPRYQVPRGRAALFSDRRIYDMFSFSQIRSATAIVRAAADRFGWTREAAAYSHAQFAWPRKQDPGPLWMRGILPGLLKVAFGPVKEERPASVA